MQDTKHFQDMLRERNIDPGWANNAIANPDRIENRDDGTRHYLKQIPEYGNRWLRVIVNPMRTLPARITAFFDRRLGRSKR